MGSGVVAGSDPGECVVIQAGDRVSAVLAADESLIDVFTSLSPTFERLRNPAMRKVMTKLVTVKGLPLESAAWGCANCPAAA